MFIEIDLMGDDSVEIIPHYSDEDKEEQSAPPMREPPRTDVQEVE